MNSFINLHLVTKSGIGWRFASYILLFSSIVTLLSTVFQLTVEYRRDVNGVEVQLDQIRGSYSPSLANSLWVASRQDLQLQLEGILHLPDMQYIEIVSDTNATIATAGEPRTGRTVVREFPLNYLYRDKQVFLGKARVVASLSGIYQRLEDKILTILATQGIKTFLVSFFILMLFQFLVGRHLKEIAAYSARMQVGALDEPLILGRPSRHGVEDEFDRAVDALNAMRLRLKESYGQLQGSEERYRLVEDATQDGLWDWDVAGGRVQYSAAWARLLGFDAEELEPSFAFWESRMHLDDRAIMHNAIQSHFQGNRRGIYIEHRLRSKDGDWKWFLGRGRVVERTPEGAPLRAVGTISDISGRKQAEEQLRLSAMVFDSMTEGVVVTDINAKILSVNKSFSEITGYKAEEVLGLNPHFLTSGHHDASFYQDLWRSLNTSGQWRGEIWDRRKNGKVYLKSLSIKAVRGQHGELIHYVGIFSDITAQKENEELILHLAQHDALTGLPNRHQVQDRLGRALANAQRDQLQVAMLFLDLDRFKIINDSLGHTVGDALLEMVAERLEKCVRPSDTVGRLSGDEFVVLLPQLRETGTPSRIAQAILDSLLQPFDIAGHSITSTFSIGISLYPNDGEDFASLLQSADTALYNAKANGRNTYQFFTRNMQGHALDRLKMENILRRALEKDELSLHYQPQIDLRTGMIIGCEALLRWNSAELGAVSPAQFIPIAEDSGLIIGIGKWVLQEACRQMREWLDAGYPEIVVAVNISSTQFRRDDLVATVEEAIQASGINPRNLELELTESVLMQDSDLVISTLSKLKDVGVMLSIDDFGTGYSSLSYLKRFSVDKLKIDQSFVRDLEKDKDDSAIVLAVIQLGRSLKLKTIAEGVETEGQLAFLREKGCHEAQGYLFSRPVPAQEFIPFLERRQQIEPEKSGQLIEFGRAFNGASRT